MGTVDGRDTLRLPIRLQAYLGRVLDHDHAGRVSTARCRCGRDFPTLDTVYPQVPGVVTRLLYSSCQRQHSSRSGSFGTFGRSFFLQEVAANVRSGDMSSSHNHAIALVSLYDRLGGEDALQAAVALFYDKVIVDPLLAPFFGQLDMTAQVRKQIGFMAHAFGGPAEYKGRDLRSAHMRMLPQGLGDAHFDAVAGHLRTTLQELDVPEALIAECLDLVSGLRNEVLNR